MWNFNRYIKKNQSIDFHFIVFLFTSAIIFCFGNLIFHFDNPLHSVSIFVTSVKLISLLYILRVFFSNILYAIIILFMTMHTIGYFHNEIVINLINIIFYISILFILFSIKLSKKQLFNGLYISFVIGLFILGLDTYTDFSLVNKVHLGQIHKDSLFHASIASMIKNYGISSTGLHGLIPINYHTFSHSLYAFVSVISEESVLNCYAYLTSIFFAPLFIYIIIQISDKIELKNIESPFILKYFLAIGILFLAPLLLGNWNIWNSYFTSESYLVGCIVFVAALPVFRKNIFDLRSNIVLFILIYILATLKISIGFVFLCIILFYVLFLSKNTILFKAFFLSISIILFYFIIYDGNNSSNEIVINPFHFIKKYSTSFDKYELYNGSSIFIKNMLDTLGIIEFILMHFSFSILFFLFLYKSKNGLFIDNIISYYYLIISIFIGFGIIIFLEIGGGSAYYFTTIPFIITIPIFINQVSDKLYFFYKKNNFYKFNSLSYITLIIITIFIFGLPIYQKKINVVATIKTRNSLVDKLITIRSQKDLGAIYVSNQTIDIDNPLSDCSARPLLYPALSERSWCNVILNKSSLYKGYGYENYKFFGKDTPFVKNSNKYYKLKYLQ
jgi:hypothetical protein